MRLNKNIIIIYQYAFKQKYFNGSINGDYIIY